MNRRGFFGALASAAAALFVGRKAVALDSNSVTIPAHWTAREMLVPLLDKKSGQPVKDPEYHARASIAFRMRHQQGYDVRNFRLAGVVNSPDGIPHNLYEYEVQWLDDFHARMDAFREQRL